MKRRAFVSLALLLASCTLGLDPDQNRFSCDTQADCGKGYECRAQYDGSRGLCYLDGVCVDESCNGKDDDCDGAIDEDWDFQNDVANCGACGRACADSFTCELGECVVPE